MGESNSSDNPDIGSVAVSDIHPILRNGNQATALATATAGSSINTENKETDWHWQFKNRVTTLEGLEKWLNLTTEEKRAIIYVTKRLPMAITPHFLSLIDKDNPECPLRRQVVPSLEEFRTSPHDLVDPCGEDKDMVVPGLVHRYPDRVVIFLTDVCAAYCRFCTRRRLVGKSNKTLTSKELEPIYEYLKKNRKIRDVLISGGDSLLLAEEKLDEVLKNLRAIEHLEILRIGTRLPVILPQRIDANLCATLKKYSPLYVNIHFNHPGEISEETKLACQLLVDYGIPLGSQTVLLKGINDSPKIIMKLMHELLKIRVRPYYLYQCDLAQGTEHFRTPVSVGLKVMAALRGYTTGLACPTYVIDAPGGGGKVPFNVDYVISRSRKGMIFRNYQGRVFVYPEKNGTEIFSNLTQNQNGKGGEKIQWPKK